MTDKEYQVLVEKAINVAPDWIKDDVKEMVNKGGINPRISYVISELFSKYSFSTKHIFTAKHGNFEWTEVARERLSFIDNNLDVIGFLHKEYTKKDQ
jgi:hypothetical protein